jgi:Sigma-70 region 2
VEKSTAPSGATDGAGTEPPEMPPEMPPAEMPTAEMPRAETRRDEISTGSGARPPARPPARPADPGGTGPLADFEKFYTAHFDRLIVQLYAYTADMAQAQDVVQEAFARALPRWERLASYDDPVGWVRRVALNLATNRWRQLRAFRSFASRHREEHISGPTPDRVALAAALAALPVLPRRHDRRPDRPCGRYPRRYRQVLAAPRSRRARREPG